MAHILALGLSQWINPDLELEALLDAIKAEGAVTVAAHPVDTRIKEHQTHFLWNHRESVAPSFDAWEVASGTVLFNEVLHMEAIRKQRLEFTFYRDPHSVVSPVGIPSSVAI